MINHLRSSVLCSSHLRTQHAGWRKQQREFQRGIQRCTKATRRKPTTRGKDRFGSAKFSHERSIACSRNISYRDLLLHMLLSSKHLADTLTISYCCPWILKKKKYLKDRAMTQPVMLSNYTVQIKNKQCFPRMILIIDLSHYSCCPDTSNYYYMKEICRELHY